MKVLAVKTGIFGDHSNSNALVDKTVAKLQAKYEGVAVVTRDLANDALPYYDAQAAMALRGGSDELSSEQEAIVKLSDELIEEVKSADIIVIGVPMYNFGIPAQMKTWFDFLSRAGVTFRYTENGPIGLLADKPVYVAAARGGVHKDQISDTQTAYLQTILGFIGLKSVSIVYAEGLAMGDEAKASAFNQFEAEVDALA